MTQKRQEQSSPGDASIIVVRAPHSLHARPAARLARTAQNFEADMTLIRGEARADAKSILDVLGLSVMEGDRLEVLAAGADADEALEAVSLFFASNYEG